MKTVLIITGIAILAVAVVFVVAALLAMKYLHVQ